MPVGPSACQLNVECHGFPRVRPSLLFILVICLTGLPQESAFAPLPHLEILDCGGAANDSVASVSLASDAPPRGRERYGRVLEKREAQRKRIYRRNAALTTRVGF